MMVFDKKNNSLYFCDNLKQYKICVTEDELKEYAAGGATFKGNTTGFSHTQGDPDTKEYDLPSNLWELSDSDLKDYIINHKDKWKRIDT